ncbi:succinate-semialdehyde dehydrogenase [Trichoderma gamsii]|uniref:Succinate-semialdehyde dehydrogenase n=1 Tax=Trichoderma gamsii TaxID=398673 RepID=A0A2P4ZRB8_9HYPO|nr:succinate-semialdehyde dehydrogenase [Trichoderma gamsii]PON26813.1 succinate-semialdehyde dehydrogenase [Trichoderma gamsii]
MSAAAASVLKDASLLKTKSYVNGEWVEAKSGKQFTVDNPATGEEVAKCPEFDAEDTEAAITAANDAFQSFRKVSPQERSRLLRRWYDLMVENAEDIAKIITLENGKALTDARGETTYAANFFKWFSEEAPRIYGDVIQPSAPNCRVVTLREPIGVCGLIAPWNFPAAMITRKVGPALAAGCTVVVKAPTETPLTALALAELAHRAGIPKGVVNVITAFDNTPLVGKVLTTNPIVKKVSFTGSTPVGKILMNQSSSTLKKLSFELGGNAPFIVFEDADLDTAVQHLIGCKFRVAGQTCVCANRIFVHSSIYEEFVKRVVDVVKTFQVGNGLDSKTTHGPLIHSRAVAKVDEHVQDAVSKGARLLHGGKRLPLGPNFYDLTVLADVTPEMQVFREETFGPVAAFFKFDTEEEVVALANDADVGLAGYFFSKDNSRCWRVAEALQVGMVGVNVGAISDVAIPFGGVKESGFGREGSKYGVDEYLTTKMIMTGI